MELQVCHAEPPVCHVEHRMEYTRMWYMKLVSVPVRYVKYVQDMRDVTPELTSLAENGTILSQYYVQQV